MEDDPEDAPSFTEALGFAALLDFFLEEDFFAIFKVSTRLEKLSSFLAISEV
tara:strand:- start:1633 stop:1788 length:156 start_codon:yes stop_codon:yes gene_type:complete